MIEKLEFHHMGVATPDIDKTVAQYRNMGYEVDGAIVYDPRQNVNICFLSHPSMPRVELLSPVDESSPVVQTINKNGVSPYHTCYTVANLDEAVKDFRGLKYMIVSKPKPACAIDGRRVAFLFHKDIGLIELVEA